MLEVDSAVFCWFEASDDEYIKVVCTKMCETINEAPSIAQITKVSSFAFLSKYTFH